MKIAVLGGYGVFGARLVRLLVRDGHEVIVAGRSLSKASSFATDVGAKPLEVDRQGDLNALWESKPQVVVDAAGPFHAYGDDPYALVRSCINNGVHYMDLADDPAFCAGIVVLDEAARAAGVFVLSGVSSVPALSSAAAAALAAGAEEVDTISSAILPGNRAPRGRSVVESILGQCGAPFDVPLDGAPYQVRSWSGPEVFDLGAGMIRKGWMIEVPDHRLFGHAFDARTVLFRAGLELWVMNHALAVFSWLRAKLRFGVPRWLVSFVLRLAKLLWPFGTDEGGMSVGVTARYKTGWQTRNWRMIARKGEGPYIPAVAARAILRDPDQIEAGARPAVAVVSLTALEDAMSDLAVTTEQTGSAITPLFETHLGPVFKSLPSEVRALHSVPCPRRWTGRARVVRGRGIWCNFLAWVFRFPPAGDDTKVCVTMVPGPDSESWTRQFGSSTFRSYLRRDGSVLTERFGPLTFTLDLQVSDGQLLFPVKAGRLGPIHLPRLLLPQSEACEYANDGRFHFDVALKAPLTGGLIVRYKGWLERRTTEAMS